MPQYTTPVYIYALADPDTERVRYVGQTTRPKKRLNEHIYLATTAVSSAYNTHRSAWIRSLLAKGDRPLFLILEVATEQTSSDIERYWIAMHESWGADLTNHTEGGESSGKYIFDDETRRKMSQAKAALTDQEVREIYVLAWRGIPYKKIIENYNTTPVMITNIKLGHHYKHVVRPPKPETERTHEGAFTDADIREIRAFLAAGNSLNVTARKYGISNRLAWSIKVRSVYRNVPEEGDTHA